MGPGLTAFILVAALLAIWLAKYYYFDEEKLHWAAALAIALAALFAIVGTVIYQFVRAIPQ